MSQKVQQKQKLKKRKCCVVDECDDPQYDKQFL